LRGHDFGEALLLEQTIKSGAGIAGVAGRWGAIDGAVGRSGGRGVARDSHHGGKEFAGVGLILAGNAHGDGFVTLEARGRIKVHALFAAV